MAAQASSLGDLCSTCLAQPPKYRCPRCPSVRTCSLPCYKRHQSRASCNGQRSETKYVKKSQLATPAGFDHDYNFLTKIERAIQTPPRASEAEQGDGRSAKRRRKGGLSPLERYCAQNNIGLEKAPVGFHRSKMNQTSYSTKSKKVYWMVEWVDTRGEKTTSKATEQISVKEAYNDIQRDPPSKEENLGSKKGSAEKGGHNREPAVNAASLARQAEVNASPIKPDQDTGKVPTLCPSDPLDATDPGIVAHSSALNTEEHAQEFAATAPSPHFYLHIPRCLSGKLVLAHLSGASSITECLRNRRILEFPTIYVLSDPPESLPERYVLEETYKKRICAEYKDVDMAHIVRNVGVTVGRQGAFDGGVFAPQEERLDDKKILEMLRRDVQA